ncbi:chaperonin GroEL [Ensifer soli]|uniref:chaperonin GroEL n=1 Tax=Ciceribacter sp. sgz301302 TaxID=3342379 RepID=UPI0035B83BF7
MKKIFVQCGNEARASLVEGIDLVADLVATGIGPCGRAVLSARNHTAPALLRGGYAIAREVEFDSPGLRAGGMAMRQLAAEVHGAAGDGTATALLLARAFVHGVLHGLSCGHSPAALRAGLDAHGEAVRRALERMTRPIGGEDEAEGIAARAAGGDREIGRLVQSANARAGVDGVVEIEAGHGLGDELTVEKGMTFAGGWLSPHFVTDAVSQTATLDKPLILLHQGAIDSFADMARILEMIARSGKELLIVADGFGPQAMATLVTNRQKNGLRVAPMKAPGAGPWRALLLEDMAVATGATLVGGLTGTALNGLRPAMLGKAGRVSMTRRSTALIGGGGEASAIAARCDGIRVAIARERYLAFDREQHQQRLARFRAGVARLRIGGETPTVLATRQARATSAAAALRAAGAGVIPGGAAALIRAGREGRAALPGDGFGRVLDTIFTRALAAPMAAILANSGQEPRPLCYLIEKSEIFQSFDVEGRRMVEADALAAPASILTGALDAALSFAATIAGVDASIAR